MAVFIDADNFNDATALDHVLAGLRSMADRVLFRLAYGRPESLKSVSAVLGKHGVRPVANLIVEKTTTDGALIIGAVEAVCTNEIDVVAICSGDADFVPLAIWLREKGCSVHCFSLSNKIFASPESFYDEVTLIDVVDQQAASVAAVPAPAVAAAKAPSVQAPPAPPPVAAAKQAKSQPPVGKSTAFKAPAPKPPAAKPAAAKPKAAKAPVAQSSAQATAKQILDLVPELRTREPLHLSQVAKKLRDAGLLGKNASSADLFRRHAGRFALSPAKQPNTVTFKG